MLYYEYSFSVKHEFILSLHHKTKQFTSYQYHNFIGRHLILKTKQLKKYLSMNIDKGDREVKPKIDMHLHMAPLHSDKKEIAHLHLSVINRIYQTLNIETGVILPGKPGDDFFGELMTNEEAEILCKEQPGKFFWFCNFSLTDSEEDIQRLSAYRENGALGFGEFVENKRLDHPAIRRIFAACQESRMSVLFHMSPECGNGYGIVDDPGLPLLEQALIDFPELTFIGHSACFWSEISDDGLVTPNARNGYPFGRVKEGRLAYLMRKYPNLTAELSAGSGANAMLRDPEYAIQFLTEFSDQLFFGTDSGVCALGPWLDMVYSQGLIAKDVYDKITRENAQRLISAAQSGVSYTTLSE